MSDSDFSMDPDELTSSSAELEKDEELVNQLEFEDSGEFDSEEPFRVYARGHADSYDQWILVVLDVEPKPEGPELLNNEMFAAHSPARFTNYDYDDPRDFDQKILSLPNWLNQSELKDTKNFENKLTGSLTQSATLEEVLSQLFEGNIKEFHQDFTDFLIGEVFPGCHLDLSVKVISLPEREEEPETNSTPDSTETSEKEDQDKETQDDDEDSLQLLRVSPELDPRAGYALSDLTVGDSFDVRIVGESVRNLSSQYLEGDVEDAKQSKIFNAQLVKIEDVSKDSFKKYIVRLGENIYGESTLEPDTRVKVRSVWDVSFRAIFKQAFYYAFLVVLILLFSLSVTFILYPEPIMDLFNTVTAPR